MTGRSRNDVIRYDPRDRGAGLPIRTDADEPISLEYPAVVHVLYRMDDGQVLATPARVGFGTVVFEPPPGAVEVQVRIKREGTIYHTTAHVIEAVRS